MGATELIQGLGRALAVLREAGHPQGVLQSLEDDITSLDAVVFRDAAEAEQWAARLVARLYGIVHPPAAAASSLDTMPVDPIYAATEPAPAPAGQRSFAPEDGEAEVAALEARIAELRAKAPGPDTHMATPAEVTGAAT